jgi:hypothetical protein
VVKDKTPFLPGILNHTIWGENVAKIKPLYPHCLGSQWQLTAGWLLYLCSKCFHPRCGAFLTRLPHPCHSTYLHRLVGSKWDNLCNTSVRGQNNRTGSYLPQASR